MPSLDLHGFHVVGALVEMNVMCGNMERARSLFEQLPKRNVVSYFSMIQGLSIHGHASQAVALVDKMLEEGIVPNKVAFTVILSACYHAGLIDQSCRYFKSMVNQYLLEPSSDHYACVIDLLGRSREPKIAYELLKSMPVEPHAGAWGALLSACKLHCELELAREVYRRLIEIEHFNTGNYVMLSDIYAAANEWTEVADLRGKIKEMRLSKIRGVSWWT
ncbi:OLC1v1020959C1 [Oldenlandia corymbosa var. corymbosa]|uniref:OLC1v1020959C1 n=1 Tax=Oldenlandia corymbosa var. corymbosa TaxID=529605 RepID=A0AAV1BVA6_OLDCO|nr:OLC1v1020959C1 [Oldenlandia corymbosa var. corymbosa]